MIVPIIKNIEVQSEGFDIISKQEISSYGIEIIQDFIQNIYVAKVVFEYQDQLLNIIKVRQPRHRSSMIMIKFLLFKPKEILKRKRKL